MDAEPGVAAVVVAAVAADELPVAGLWAGDGDSTEAAVTADDGDALAAVRALDRGVVPAVAERREAARPDETSERPGDSTEHQDDGGWWVGENHDVEEAMGDGAAGYAGEGLPGASFACPDLFSQGISPDAAHDDVPRGAERRSYHHDGRSELEDVEEVLEGCEPEAGGCAVNQAVSRFVEVWRAVCEKPDGQDLHVSSAGPTTKSIPCATEARLAVSLRTLSSTKIVLMMPAGMVETIPSRKVWTRRRRGAGR